MKVCITSTGPSLDGEMNPRFGRCQYFIFVDPDTMKFEAIENPNLGAAGGAGIQSAQLVINRGGGGFNYGPRRTECLHYPPETVS